MGEVDFPKEEGASFTSLYLNHRPDQPAHRSAGWSSEQAIIRLNLRSRQPSPLLQEDKDLSYRIRVYKQPRVFCSRITINSIGFLVRKAIH